MTIEAAPGQPPAAPPAPAPAAPPAAPAPELSLMEQAKLKANEFVAKLGQPPADPAPPAQPRRDDGTFAPKADPAAPAADAGAPPVAGDDPAAQAAGAAAEVDTGAGAPAAEGEFVDIAFPGRRPGEELVLSFPKDREEDARRLANKVTAVEKLEAERHLVAREAQMVRETQFIIQSDPVGFVMEQLDPTLRPSIVKHLLSDPNVFNAVAADLEQFLDPNEREKAQLRLQVERSQLRDQTKQQLAERQRGEQHAGELRQAVLDLIPESWSPEQASTLLRDGLLDLGQYAETARVRRIDPSMVPVILAARLRAFGIDPVLAANRLAERRSGAPAAPTPGKTPGASRVTVKQFQAAAAATANLAATPPAGAGSLPAGSAVKPPPGASLKDASRLALQSLGRTR